MKKFIQTTLRALLIVVSCIVTSCQEETIQPAHDVPPPRDAASGLSTGR